MNSTFSHAPCSQPPLLELRGIGFQHQHSREPLLSGVNFAIRKGERVGLVGANGCGKTTLLRMMVGLFKPSSGEVIAFGSARREERDFIDVRARVGLVFQDADDQLFCPTVLEDVVFGPLNLGKSTEDARKIALSTLAQVGLEGFEDRITYRLSGGQKRLVSLACVLSMEPEVLLLDEPTGGLDEDATGRVLKILRDLPMAMVVVSHEKLFVESLVNRVIAIEEGKLISNKESC